MGGTSIENEAEIYATNLTNKTKCIGINTKKWRNNFEDMYNLPLAPSVE
jgi:hypothetical protein